MKKCVIVPDSFKGSMSSKEVCSIMKEAVLKRFPSCEVIAIPIADGGEGTVDCFLEALLGEKVFVDVKGPYCEKLTAFYGKSGDLGIVETAAAAGLTLVKDCPNPEKTTTFGVGQLIKKAIDDGCKKIIVGLGGSCTNDAGAGAAAALGVDFFDERGDRFIPVGGTLDKVSRIYIQNAKKLFSDVEIIAMCDIKNTMCGPYGAAFIYGPQKGADEMMVRRLDENMIKFSKVIKKSLKIDVSDLEGGGASGGMGAGFFALLGAKMQFGIDAILDVVEFDSKLENCDMVLTGEGAIDFQSADGKALSGIGKAAMAHSVPVIAFAGKIEKGAQKMCDCGITHMIPIHPTQNPLIIENSKENLFNAVFEFLVDVRNDVVALRDK